MSVVVYVFVCMTCVHQFVCTCVSICVGVGVGVCVSVSMSVFVDLPVVALSPPLFHPLEFHE